MKKRLIFDGERFQIGVHVSRKLYGLLMYFSVFHCEGHWVFTKAESVQRQMECPDSEQKDRKLYGLLRYFSVFHCEGHWVFTKAESVQRQMECPDSEQKDRKLYGLLRYFSVFHCEGHWVFLRAECVQRQENVQIVNRKTENCTVYSGIFLYFIVKDIGCF